MKSVHILDTLLGTHSHEEYDTRCYFNVRSKADISQLNLPHGKRNLNKDKLLIFIDGCDNEKHEITYIYDTKQV